jgi:branched-chain amino acid transport system permease protein
MDRFLRLLFEQTINGLVIGNIYALIAVGLAIIFGVGNLINFAHGSVYMVGAYIGWYCVGRLNLPLPLAFVVVALLCGLIGVLIERFGLRRLQGSARIAPLLATIGISFMLDQLVQIVFTARPQSFPNPFSQVRFPIGETSIGGLDLLIAGVGITSAALLYLFLRYSRLGWALRATAQDRDAAQQMGVDVHRVNQVAFALAAALGGVAGMLVGMYVQQIDPAMSFQAGLKGFAANLLGGLGNIPGALIGGLLLGLIESYGVGALGASYRNLFAFVILIGVLVWRPNGLFRPRRHTPPEPLTGTFIPNNRLIHIPKWLVLGVSLFALAFPVLFPNPYWLQVLTNAWLLGLVALSVTLITGTAGQTALGQAGFVAIGAYTAALLTLRLNWHFELALIAAGIVTALLGTLLVLPAFRLRAYYVAIATIGIGEIVNQVILNWDAVTNGALGLSGIPPPSLLGNAIVTPPHVYWATLALLLIVALVQWRLTRSGLGRIWRALREDEIAAQSYGINLNRYKALAFGCSAFIAGISGAFTAHMYSYIDNASFTATTSVLALTMAILGGLGNIAGAILGAVVLTILPEVFRGLVDYRYLLYGLVLVLLVRFRPQGLMGTE